MATVQKLLRPRRAASGKLRAGTYLVSNPNPRTFQPLEKDKPLVFPPNSLLLRKAKKTGVPLPQCDIPVSNYGQYIYLYVNIQTNQVVYSLTRHLNNKDAIDQLPYLGKKTVPPALRKDLWTPLAMVCFPSYHAGLDAYRKLREFRRLHETSYDLADITDKNGKYAGSLYPKKQRGRILMNQKANSIADLAAVLSQLSAGPNQERVERQERRIQRIARLKEQKGPNKVDQNPVDIRKEMGGVQGICVRWTNTLDAEYAETWPEAVIHDELRKNRHTVAWPAVEEEEVVEEKVVFEKPAEEPKSAWQRLTSIIPRGMRRAAVATA